MRINIFIKGVYYMIKKIFLCFLCFTLMLTFLIENTYLNCYALTNSSSEVTDECNYKTRMKQDILILMLAYPEYITDISCENDNVYIVMKSGKKFIYDDKKNKTSEEKLSNPDLQDMMEEIYPLTKTNEIMPKAFNPGRIRHYGLLNEVYGDSQSAIEKNLCALKYGYTNYQFNSKNGANTALENTMKELVPLSKGNPKIGAILYPASGTYNYRLISGTGRLSPHAYGITIDLKSDKRDYWKWSSAEKGKSRLCEYPDELVSAFENHNFIWGGKWGYFDILHFEYRPEIILKAKYFSNYNSDNEWFKGAPEDDINVKECIKLIDSKIQ